MVGNMGWLAILAYISALLKRSQCHWRPGWVIQFSIAWRRHSCHKNVLECSECNVYTANLHIALLSRWGRAKFPCICCWFVLELWERDRLRLPTSPNLFPLPWIIQREERSPFLQPSVPWQFRRRRVPWAIYNSKAAATSTDFWGETI